MEGRGRWILIRTCGDNSRAASDRGNTVHKSDRSSYICANWLNLSSRVACRPTTLFTVEEMVSIQNYVAFVEWNRERIPSKTGVIMVS